MDGTLVFEGRADTQIKIRGHRVDMTEVDVAAKKVTGLEKVTTLCYNPGELNQVRERASAGTSGKGSNDEGSGNTSSNSNTKCSI